MTGSAGAWARDVVERMPKRVMARIAADSTRNRQSLAGPAAARAVRWRTARMGTGQTAATGTALAGVGMRTLRAAPVRGTWKVQRRGLPLCRALGVRGQIVMGPAALTVRCVFRAATPAAHSKMTEAIRAAGPSLDRLPADARRWTWETEEGGPISTRLRGLAGRTMAATVAALTGFPPAVIVLRRGLTGRTAGSSLRRIAAADGSASLPVAARTRTRGAGVAAEMTGKAGHHWS